MKKFLLVLFLAVSLPTCVNVSAEEVEVPLTAEKIVWPIGSEKPARGPVAIPSLTLDGYTLYIYSDHPDCTVQLVDSDDVVFELHVPAGTTTIQLPNYTGRYRLNLLWGNWCFWGYITL